MKTTRMLTRWILKPSNRKVTLFEEKAVPVRIADVTDIKDCGDRIIAKAGRATYILIK